MTVLPSPDVNASSSTSKSYIYDPNVPFKKRFKLTEDSPETRKRSRFVIIEEDEEDFYTQKVESFFEEMRKKFGPNVRLATKRATKICPPLYIEDDENKQKKKRKIPMKIKRGPVVISNDMTEQLERFITRDEINGSDLKLVIQKRLFKSDLRDDQNRLNMPIKQLQTLDFLKPDDKSTAKPPRSSIEDDDEEKKLKRTKRKMQKEIEKRLKNAPPISNDVTEQLKQFIEGDEINGSDLTLVIQKLLYFSDLKDDQNRLTMPFNQLKTFEFFKVHEKQLLDNKGEFNVQLMGPTLRMFDEKLTLKMWPVNSTQSYVLKTKWNDFVREHKDVLIENAIVQVWSFRKDGKLCFALAVVEKAPTISLLE